MRICPKCGYEIHPSEATRHGYSGEAHEYSRCVQLLRADNERLQEAGDVLAEFAQTAPGRLPERVTLAIAALAATRGPDGKAKP